MSSCDNRDSFHSPSIPGNHPDKNDVAAYTKHSHHHPLTQKMAEAVEQVLSPHVELTREVARCFNHLYRKGIPPLFPEPRALLMASAKLPGLDGRKALKMGYRV